MRRILFGLVASLVVALSAGVVAFAQTQAKTPPLPAHNRGAKLIMTYERTGGMTRDPDAGRPGLIFALWDDGWAITHDHLRADRGGFVAVRFSKDALERMKATIARGLAESSDSLGASMAPDASYATLTLRTPQGVKGFTWDEHLHPDLAKPDRRAAIAGWITCTSIVFSEMPEEILAEKDAVKGGVFRGLNPHAPRPWPEDDAK